MKKIYTLTVLLLMGLQLQAQIFWELRSKHSKNVSYVLGVHSAIPAVAFDTMKLVYKAFNRSGVIISRYENYRVDSESAIKKETLLPDNINLKQFYTDSVYNLLDKELKANLKLGLKELGKMHPFILRQMYLSELSAKSIGIKDDIQTDSYFQIAASETAKRIVGLENYDNYIHRYLDKRDVKYQADKLVDDTKNAKVYMSVFLEFYKAYCKGDLMTLEELLKKNLFLNADFTGQSDVFIIPEKLISLLQKNKCFYLVDLRDLSGKNNVLEQLKNAGFEFKPVVKIK